MGNGEIYFADLETGRVERLTANIHGQFFPTIRGIPWSGRITATRRSTCGYDLLKDAEFRLTDSAFNEAHPRLVDQFVLYEEDSSIRN